MSDKKEEKKSKSKQEYPLLNFNHLQRFSIVIITTLVIVIGLVALGHWLDQKFETKPWLLIISLIISFPLSQLAVYKQMKRFTKKEFNRLEIKHKK